VTLWLGDFTTGDNGILDNFSGALSWAIYTDHSGTPGLPIVSGNAANILLSDTGHQADFGDYDVFQVSFELSDAVPLGPGTYFLLIHENEWGSSTDTSIVWWMVSSTVDGESFQLSDDLVNPGSWYTNTTADAAFAHYGSRSVWYQGGVDPADELDISAHLTASDFALAAPTTFSTLDVWLVDATGTSDNGVLDGFSGTLSWAIYLDQAGKPGALQKSGSDASPAMADTGLQSSSFDGDIVRARIDLGGLLLFHAGTYWLALHEGLWASPGDVSPISWARGLTAFHEGSLQDDDPTAPSGWEDSFPFDTAFILFENQIFAAGFEAGGTCAWSNGAAIDCF
jgi:hypothetical protein